MRSQAGRLGALESAVEKRVEEEIDAMITVLERNLSREEFVRVLKVLAEGNYLEGQ